MVLYYSYLFLTGYWNYENAGRKDEEQQTLEEQKALQNEKQRIFLALGCGHNSRRTTTLSDMGREITGS